MARSHFHFFRLNPVATRTRKESIDVLGLIALALDLPASLLWMAWFLGMVSPVMLPRLAFLAFCVILPTLGLLISALAYSRRRRSSDVASFSIPLSLALIGVGLVYGVLRLF